MELGIFFLLFFLGFGSSLESMEVAKQKVLLENLTLVLDDRTEITLPIHRMPASFLQKNALGLMFGCRLKLSGYSGKAARLALTTQFFERYNSFQSKLFLKNIHDYFYGEKEVLTAFEELLKAVKFFCSRESTVQMVTKACFETIPVLKAVLREPTVLLVSKEGTMIPIPMQFLTRDFKKKIEYVEKGLHNSQITINCQSFNANALSIVCEMILFQSSFVYTKNRFLEDCSYAELKEYLHETDDPKLDKVKELLNTKSFLRLKQASFNTNIVPMAVDHIKNYLNCNLGHKNVGGLAISEVATNIDRARELLKAMRFLRVREEFFNSALLLVAAELSCDPLDLFQPQDAFCDILREANVRGLPPEKDRILDSKKIYCDQLRKELNLFSRGRRGRAFRLLKKQSKIDPTITHPHIFDDESLQSLDVVTGSREPESYLGKAVFDGYVFSEVGRAIVYTRLCQPTDDPKEIIRRQSHIKLFMSRQKLCDELDALYEDFFRNPATENCIFSFLNGRDRFFRNQVSINPLPRGVKEWAEYKRVIDEYTAYFNSHEIIVTVLETKKVIRLLFYNTARKSIDATKEICYQQLLHVLPKNIVENMVEFMKKNLSRILNECKLKIADHIRPKTGLSWLIDGLFTKDKKKMSQKKKIH